MVGTWYPTGIFAIYACFADEDVLNGVVEHMSHIEKNSHVGRWNYNGVWLSFIGTGTKQFVLLPIFIPFVFYFTWIVFASEFNNNLCLWGVQYLLQKYK